MMAADERRKDCMLLGAIFFVIVLCLVAAAMRARLPLAALTAALMGLIAWGAIRAGNDDDGCMG
jgi:hypothetical protein